MKSMDYLFYALLQYVYSAEKELLKALPELTKKSTSKTLQQAFADDRDETEEHLERLEKVFEAIGKMPRGKICEAMLAIIAESRHVIMKSITAPCAMPASWLPRRQPSTIKLRVTERCGPGQSFSAKTRLLNSSVTPWKRRST